MVDVNLGGQADAGASAQLDPKVELKKELNALEKAGLLFLRDQVLAEIELVLKAEAAKLQGEAGLLAQTLLAAALPSLDVAVKAKLDAWAQGL